MMLFYRKTSMISVEPNEVTSVRIVNGNNGNMLDLSEEEISELTNRCRVIDCKRIINKEPGSGWSYSIDFLCMHLLSRQLFYDYLFSLKNSHTILIM